MDVDFIPFLCAEIPVSGRHPMCVLKTAVLTISGKDIFPITFLAARWTKKFL